MCVSDAEVSKRTVRHPEINGQVAVALGGEGRTDGKERGIGWRCLRNDGQIE